METRTAATVPSKGAKITGWVLSLLPMALILFSATMKLLHPPQLDEGFNHLGVPVGHALGLGILELSCVVIYLFPRTAVLGAILFTGYLGGAIQTHIRVGDPLLSSVVVIIVLAVMLWGGVFLREPRLRALIPLRK